MPHRDFDAALEERRRLRDPITFLLGGKVWECLPNIPLAAVWGFADTPEEFDNGVDATRAFAGFIADALLPEQVPAWWEMMGDKTHLIDGQSLMDVTEHLGAMYAGRPTSPSTESSDGRPTTSGTSNSRRLKKASTTSES